ncbi:MAG: NUDIX domain-containing protein, partial [Paracoccaceae bacterium]
MARLFAIDEPLAFAKTTLRRAAASLTPDRRAGDHAQAVMDLGATICTPRNPDCADCPLGANCQAFATGQVARLPKRAPRAKKPRRLGVAYVLWRSDGALLIENRPVNGLLGGMPGFPTTDWCDAPENNPPAPADWQVLPGEIRHAFTHFHLTLSVQVALAGRGANPARGAFVPPAQFNPGGLPTVMRKVHDLAIGAGMPA